MPSEKITAMPQKTSELTAQIALTGNLVNLTESQRWEHYQAYCNHLGLDPITRPFDLLTTTNEDGTKKTVLYANASCASQIADKREVSYGKPEYEVFDKLQVIVIRVCARMSNRERWGEGVVDLLNKKGRSLENALKKASTQAHRRATLALCGIAMPDESEVEDIPDATIMPVARPVEIDSALGGIYDRIGQLLKDSGQEDSSGARRWILDWMKKGPWQAIAANLKTDPDALRAEFWYLAEKAAPQPAEIEQPAEPSHATEYENRLAAQIEKARIEKLEKQAATPVPTDAVPIDNTVMGFRQEVIDLGMALKHKYAYHAKINPHGVQRMHEVILSKISERLGHRIEAFKDVKDGELQDAYDLLAFYGNELADYFEDIGKGATNVGN